MVSPGADWRSAAVTARSPTGVVAAGAPAAAGAGAAIMAAGGNAVDGLVAAAFVCFVVEPHNCGLGGYGRLTAYVPERVAFSPWTITSARRRPPGSACTRSIPRRLRPTTAGR